MTCFVELKRRNVLRVAAAYIVTAWLIIQVAETILPQYGLEHHVRTIITVPAIGFIPAMILAWALEWTPEGIRLDAGAGARLDAGLPRRGTRRRGAGPARETAGTVGDRAVLGDRLGVSHVLTGAVTQIGTGIRVRARLVDAGSGAALWSKAYSGGFRDVFSIQDEIAGDVVKGLELETSSSLPESRRTTPEVLALTLQAKQLWNNEFDEDNGAEMAALLNEALEIDPCYTPAMGWMIAANYKLRNEGVISREEEHERWLKLAGRILAIEPDNAGVHNMFGWEALYVDHDLQAAASSYARSIRSEPNDANNLRTAAG